MERSSYEKLLTRREALLAALSAAAVGTLGAGCAETVERPRGRAGRFLDADEMTLLADVAEIVIPATDTPGAAAANVHVFIDTLMADWASAATQSEIRSAIDAVNAAALSRYDAGFDTLSENGKTDVVAGVDAAAFTASPDEKKRSERRAFRRLKELILRGYYLSRIGATEELQYDPLPGEFRGCVPLARIGRTWAA